MVRHWRRLLLLLWYLLLLLLLHHLRIHILIVSICRINCKIKIQSNSSNLRLTFCKKMGLTGILLLLLHHSMKRLSLRWEILGHHLRVARRPNTTPGSSPRCPGVGVAVRVVRHLNKNSCLLWFYYYWEVYCVSWCGHAEAVGQKNVDCRSLPKMPVEK